MAACLTLGLAGFSAAASAASSAEERAEMQRRLNEEVMSRPFDAGDVAKADAYAEEALKKKVRPVERFPSYWQPGWTCAHITRSPYYRYSDYRDCVYYHRYHGRYW